MTLFSHQDKRKIREEIERKRRNTEEEKLKLQYLKVCVVRYVIIIYTYTVKNIVGFT